MKPLRNQASMAVPLSPTKTGGRMTRTTVLFTVSAVLILLPAVAFLLMDLDFESAEEVARSMAFRSLPV